MEKTKSTPKSSQSYTSKHLDELLAFLTLTEVGGGLPTFQQARAILWGFAASLERTISLKQLVNLTRWCCAVRSRIRTSEKIYSSA